jgi:hypothetical protein
MWYMDYNNSKSTSDIKDASVKRYKALKRPPTDTDNPMVKVLESMVSGLEGSWVSALTFVAILNVEH